MGENKITRFISISGIIAAIYILTTCINPLGYGAIQLRVSEALAVIPFFKKKFKWGIYIGVIIANFFSPLGIIDIAAGLACQAIQYEVLNKLKINNYLKAVLSGVSVGIIIGLELVFTCNIEFMLAFLSTAASNMIIYCLGVFIFGEIFKKIKLDF